MALKPTYLLAPNFEFRPGGTIELGNIIADPFRPDLVLAPVDTNIARPEIEEIAQDNFFKHRSADHGVNFSIWAQFLASFGIKFDIDFSKNIDHKYAMTSLKTQRFKSEPSEQELHQMVNVEKVQKVLQSSRFRSCPVYMISGTKIAENLEVTLEVGANKGASGSASAPVPEPVSIGVNAGFTKGESQMESFQVRQDVVFAYQLLEIRLKGWKAKTLETKTFLSEAALLGDKEEEDSEIEVEATDATAASLLALDRKDIQLKQIEVRGGDEACICISFPEEEDW